jgi:lambda repressor-like predicted transcriptional regulator
MMQPDWHSADIIAALKKRGTSLAALSRKAGLAPLRWQTRCLARGRAEKNSLRMRWVYHRKSSGLQDISIVRATA